MTPASNLVITMAGVTFRIVAPEPILGRLSEYYQSMACAREPDAAVVVDILTWGSDSLVFAGEADMPIPFSSPDQGIFLLEMMLTRRLLHLRPGMMAVHGNVIQQRDKGIVLVGASGSGKTSQTIALLDSPETTRVLHAEDLVLIDFDEGVVWPFPRAATIRTRGAEMYRSLSAGPSQPLPFKAIAYWMILFADEKPDSDCSFVVVLSHLPEELDLCSLELPGMALSTDRSGFPVLRFETQPSAPEIAMLLDVLNQRGVLVIWAGKTPLTSRRVFPESPSLSELELADALPAVASHEIRVTTRCPQEEGRRLFRLAGAMGNASYWNLRPGGSPSVTARLIDDRVFAIGGSTDT